ncbi:MAG: c-type cytochrome, partial [Gemmataceae bacterium]|nr:c-type cytochrome [Gemmataceae bacterium]MDW8267477.1 hypothetical protein [Gemmataceae bacterium]
QQPTGVGEQVRRQLPPHLLADAGRLLRNTTYQDLRVRAATVFPPPPKIDPKKVPSPASLAQRIGNAAHGRELLAASLRNDLQCLKCHTIHGLGGSIGPDLSVIGKKASRENLFESILQPSKAVADQYVTWQVATSKGLVLNGLLVEETPDSLTLRDANGKDTRIDKSDIEARAKLPTSLMPDNLLAFMTVDDLVDIVEYLFSLKTPSTPVLQWHLAAPVRPKPATVPIDSVDIPERHINLQSVFHAKSPNPVTWRPAQATAQGFVDVRPFLGTNNATSLVYAQAHIESPEAQPGAILFSASTPCKIFVNDDLVYTRREARPAVPCEESILVSWKKGRNVVMVKLAVEPGSTSEGFFLRGLAERELKAIFVTPKAP